MLWNVAMLRTFSVYVFGQAYPEGQGGHLAEAGAVLVFRLCFGPLPCIARSL